MPVPKAAPTAELTPEEFATSLEADFEKHRNRVLSPEDFAAGIADVYPAQPSLLRAFAGSALETAASVPEAGAIAAQKLGGALGMSQETPFFDQWAGGLRGAAQLLDPQEARGRGGVAEDVVRAGGSMAGAAPAMALGPIAAGIQFGAQSGVPLYYQIKAKTNDEEAATLGLLFGAAVGQLEKFGAEKAATSVVRKLLGKGLGEAIESLAVRSATGFVKGAAAETGTELLQTALEDKIYETLSDDDVDNWESLKQALPPSLLLGGAFGALDHAIESGRARAEAATQEPSVAAGVVQGSTPSPEQAAAAEVARPTAESGGEGLTAAAPAPEAPTPPTLPQEEGAATVEPQPAKAATPAPSPSQEPPSATPTAPAEPSTAHVAASEPSPESVPPQQTTGVKNATVARELEKMGLPPPDPSERVTDLQRHARAKETFEKDPSSGSRLVDDLEANPRPPNGDEDALLAFEANRLIVEREAAEDAYNSNPSEATQKRVERAKADYARTADVLKRSGSESSASLRLRRMMLARDYSLAEMERSFQVAKGGEPLTAQESAKVKALHEQIAALEKKHAELTSAAEAKRAELAAENAMLRLKKAASGAGRRAARANQIAQAKAELGKTLDELGAHFGTKAGAGLGALDGKTLALTAKAALQSIQIGVKSLAQFADSMVARYGEGIRPYLGTAWSQAQVERRKELAASLRGKELGSIGPTVNKIAEGFVEDGVTNLEELISKVHEVLQETHPEITRSEARDALSGYGQFRQLSKSEVKAKLRDLKGQMRQFGKLEDLNARMAPKKTGFERREPSAAEQRLAKQARELAKRLGINAADLDAAKMKARKTRMTNQIADLEARIAAKDFGPRVKPAPLNPDTETIAVKAKLESTRRQFERAKEQQRLSQRNVLQKGIDAAKEVLDLSVAIRSSLDFSAVRRQGGFFTSGHPLRARKHMAEMFRAWANPEAAARVDTLVRERWEKTGKEAKLELTSVDGDLLPGEEAIRSKLSDRIPGLKASNRAYVTYLNLQRISAFEAMTEALPTKPTPAEMKDIAHLVNVATGRASGKAGKAVAKALGGTKFFWAPSFLVSRFQLALEPLRIAKPGKMTRQVRAAIGKELLRYVAGQAAYYGLLGAAAGATADALDEEFDIEVDPRSSDFGKVRIGDTRIDPLGGLAQVATFLSREISGTTKTRTGEVRKLEKVRPVDSTRADVALRFLRSKAGPIPGTIWNLMEGTTYVGEKPSLATEVPVPLVLADSYRAMRELGIPTGTAVSALALLGDGVQTYDAEDKKK